VGPLAGKASMTRSPHHSVYVVELRPAVLKHRRFADANPGHQPGKECLYVGMTGLDPEERLARHREGHKASYYVTRYGLHLRPDLYEHLNPMAYEKARDIEVQLADSLRKRGYAVWQS
jgi:predicted GIY-YIG superfamily endonuclease